jgi:hypothetical protein
MAGRITGIAIIDIGDVESPEPCSGLFATQILPLAPEGGAVEPVPRFAERGRIIFLALALEFLLGRLETCDACRNFFPLARQSLFLFGHCPSRFLLDSCPAIIGGPEWGANWDAALRDCDRVCLHSEGGG